MFWEFLRLRSVTSVIYSAEFVNLVEMRNPLDPLIQWSEFLNTTSLIITNYVLSR